MEERSTVNLAIGHSAAASCDRGNDATIPPCARREAVRPSTGFAVDGLFHRVRFGQSV